MKRLILSLLLIQGLAVCAFAAEPRHALVMGVWNYADPTFPSLPGIETDVRKMGTKLESLGFKVTVVTNPTLKQAKQSVDDFGTTLKAARGIGLFYFSGHGSEFEGKNFLIPTGTAIKSNRDLDEESLAADRVLDRMADSGGNVNIVFLDCCRNQLSKAGGSSLAAMEAKGTFIGFATASAQIAGAAAEGSAYTAALLEKLGTPGVSINDMHTMVTQRVMELTEGTQVPFQYSGLNIAFALVPATPTAAASLPSLSDAEIQRRIDEEVRRRMASVALPSTSTSLPPAAAGPPISMYTPKVPTFDPAKAEKSKPFLNSLAMRFVPVPGTKVLFCVHETRNVDYAAYATRANRIVPDSWKKMEAGGVPMTLTDDHPVVGVSWDDAVAFCDWLSQAEGMTYRLPTDHEWSIAVGIGDLERASASPANKDMKIPNVFPWGKDYPPRNVVGNYMDRTANARGLGFSIHGYTDGYANTAPVMSFEPNKLGLYGLGGNVWEWCEDWYNPTRTSRVMRGASWSDNYAEELLSSHRSFSSPGSRRNDGGFRVVLVVPAK